MEILLHCLAQLFIIVATTVAMFSGTAESHEYTQETFMTTSMLFSVNRFLPLIFQELLRYVCFGGIATNLIFSVLQSFNTRHLFILIANVVCRSSG